MDALLRRRLMMQQGGGPTPPPTPVPAGYTALTYVENPLGNTAYINTGILASNTIGFYIDAQSYDQIADWDAGTYGCFFGGRYASNNRDFQLSTYIGTSTWGGTLRRGGSGQNYDAHLPNQTRFQASLVGNVYSTGGNDYTVSANIASSNQRNIYLFALNNNNSAVQIGHIRVYRFWLTSNGTKVIDYYPCRRDLDSKVGFYDLVNEVFIPPTSGTLYGVE